MADTEVTGKSSAFKHNLVNACQTFYDASFNEDSSEKEELKYEGMDNEDRFVEEQK